MIDIEPNKLTKMTEDLHRLFNANDCDPACHCCGLLLKPGTYFRLASITELDIVRARQKQARYPNLKVFKHDKPHEVMLCNSDACTPSKMIDNLTYPPYIKRSMRDQVVETRKYGCFIVDGKIV